MVGPGWLPIFICLASHAFSLPKPDGEEGRKVLGSSVVTSVSVIMDHGNGTKTYVSDGTTQPLPKPQRLIGSPADLMEPDRYEFYTFDETGDLVKRLMTLEEIQSLIAAGGDGEGIVGGPSMQPYYDQNLKTNSEQDQTLQTMDTEQSADMPGVYKVVQNVQNVLKGELAASQAKPLNQIPDLSMPDAASSWSILFPNVLDESLHSDINHLSEVVPEADPNMKVPPAMISTTTSFVPQRLPVTSTQSLKFTDREPTTTDSSLVIHYLPINAIPSKNHNKKPSKPTGGFYDKYKPTKESTTLKTTYYQEATSAKPSSTWSTLVTQPSSTTKQNLEAIKLNPQLSDSFSNMLNQVTENPQTIIDDKYTKPSSAVPIKYSSTVKKNYTSIPLTTTMRVPNPVSTTSSFNNKYKNATKQQVKTNKPVESVKLNVSKPVSTFGTTQYDRISTVSTRPFNTNNIQTVGTKRPPLQDVTKQSVQTEYAGDFKNNGLQVQNLQSSSSLKTSPPVRTTPYNANNVKIQANSQRPVFDNSFKENAEKLTASSSTNFFAEEGSTKTYNPSTYVNNLPVMSTKPASSSSIQPHTTTKPFIFFTTLDDNIFSEPFMSNSSTQIYNPTLYINNQPILSTKPIQYVSPLRQSTTPMYHVVTETPQILSSQSYVSKPNPYLQNSFQTTPRTSHISTNYIPSTTNQIRNPSSASTNKFEQLKSTTQNNFLDKNTQNNKIQGNNEIGLNPYNELKTNTNDKPAKIPTQPVTSSDKVFTSQNNRLPINEKLDQVKNTNTALKTENNSSIQKNKITNATNSLNKLQTNNGSNKHTTNGHTNNSKFPTENKINTHLPLKSNTNPLNGNYSVSESKINKPLPPKSNTNKISGNHTVVESKNNTHLPLKSSPSKPNGNHSIAQTKTSTNLPPKSNINRQSVSNSTESRTNAPLPPKSNINRPNGNQSSPNKHSTSAIKGALKPNSTSEKYSKNPVTKNNEKNATMTKISQANLVSTTRPNKVETTEINRDFLSTLDQDSTLTKIETFETTKVNVGQLDASKKPELQFEKLKENEINKNKSNVTGTVKINSSTINNKKSNATIKTGTSSTKSPENSTRKSSNKTTEIVKSATKTPLNTQNKGSLKVSQGTSPKPVSSTQNSINPSSERNHEAETIKNEAIKTLVSTDKPSWSTVSDSDSKNNSPSESTVYIRVNTTTPQAPSTERSSQSKITYTRYPETTSLKQTATSISDSTHLDDIVHDGISAVTNMLQHSSPVVTPSFEKITSESVTEQIKESVTSDSSPNLTTNNVSSFDDKTETVEQTTTEMNYLEIKQSFDTNADLKYTTSSQFTGSHISTVPVMGETKHASTEAIEQLLNDLISLSSEGTSPTPIESASLVREDEQNTTNLASTTYPTEDNSSTSTETAQVTTIFDEDLGKLSEVEQTTLETEKNLEASANIETTTQPFHEQDSETVQPLENNKTLEKLEATIYSTTPNSETYNESSTENLIDQKESEDTSTITYPGNESSVTTDSTLATDQTATITETDQADVISTAAPTIPAMLSELRTEAMDLDIDTTPSISSTTETIETSDDTVKSLNSTWATSTSTIETTETLIEEQAPNKPTADDLKLDHQDIIATPETKEAIESSKTASGVKPNHQKHSTVELHPPPHEHMGLEASTVSLGDDIKRFADLCNELAFKMWTSLTGKGTVSSRSLVLSPFAATSILAMVFLGARGPTSGQMNDILRLDDMVSFNPHQVLQNVTDSVIHAKRNGIDTAAFVRELYSDKAKGKILDFYKERVQQYYDGHVEEVGFHIIGDVLRRRTNLLVKRQTQGKVPEYLRGSTLSLKPPLAAFTANIFQTECERASTEGRDGEMYFVVRPSTRQRRLVPVPAAVWRTGFTAGYEPSLDATAVSLNHGSDNTISSVYVLAGQQGQVAPGDGLAQLEQRLIETSYRRGGWSRLLRSLLRRPGLELQLPRFSHRSVLNVTATLQRMGLKDVFSSEKADLRGLNGIPNDLHLSDIIQVNTFSTCAEENIGARHHIETFPVSAQRVGREETFVRSAAPPVSPEALSDHLPLNLRPRQGRIPDAPRLRFDRPFLYLVRHNPTGMILYMGRFNPRLLA